MISRHTHTHHIHRNRLSQPSHKSSDSISSMSFHSPRQSQTQFQYNPSTPPPPPPKPSAHSSRRGTPLARPPLPPPPGQTPQLLHDQPHAPTQFHPQDQPQPDQGQFNSVHPPEDGWLPAILKDKTYVTPSTHGLHA